MMLVNRLVISVLSGVVPRNLQSQTRVKEYIHFKPEINITIPSTDPTIYLEKVTGLMCDVKSDVKRPNLSSQFPNKPRHRFWCPHKFGLSPIIVKKLKSIVCQE